MWPRIEFSPLCWIPFNGFCTFKHPPEIRWEAADLPLSAIQAGHPGWKGNALSHCATWPIQHNLSNHNCIDYFLCSWLMTSSCNLAFSKSFIFWFNNKIWLKIAISQCQWLVSKTQCCQVPMSFIILELKSTENFSGLIIQWFCLNQEWKKTALIYKCSKMCGYY